MTPSETSPLPLEPVLPPPRWGLPVWERDEVLREQVALLRQNFPMTLLASLATALGTLWVSARVAATQAITVWLVSHTLVVAGVDRTLHSIAPFVDAAPQAARKLIACMAAMGLSWGSLGYVVLYWGNSDSVIYAIGIISTVSSGALGLGAPLYRAYVTYLTSAIGGVMLSVTFDSSASSTRMVTVTVCAMVVPPDRFLGAPFPLRGIGAPGWESCCLVDFFDQVQLDRWCVKLPIVAVQG